MTTPTSTPRHAESDSYAQSGFCTRMGWGTRPALLLVDVCKAYWTPGSPLDLSSTSPHHHHPAAAAAAAVPDVIRRLLAAARGSAGVPVLWTAVEYHRDAEMRDAGLFWRKAKSLDVFRAGDPRGLGGWVDEDLTPAAGEVVVAKKYASGFFGTTLASELACLGADTVVVVGVSTSGCVRATALDAMQHGFRPMVSSWGVICFFGVSKGREHLLNKIPYHERRRALTLRFRRLWVQLVGIGVPRSIMQICLI